MGMPDHAHDRPLAVFDIDGVVADVRHRLHHVEQAPKNWKAFFAAAVNDPPLAAGFTLLRGTAEHCDVMFLTGRPAFCRADTLGWLRTHEVHDPWLTMRPAGNRRPARETKVALLTEIARTRRIHVVVDDDELVIDAMTQAGFPTLHADWMPKSATLAAAQERDGRT